VICDAARSHGLSFILVKCQGSVGCYRCKLAKVMMSRALSEFSGVTLRMGDWGIFYLSPHINGLVDRLRARRNITFSVGFPRRGAGFILAADICAIFASALGADIWRIFRIGPWRTHVTARRKSRPPPLMGRWQVAWS
jgi:hypothetical protein